MKRCTYCGKEYPDEATVCSRDQESLITFTEPAATVPETKPAKTRATQIVAPAVLWLIVNVVLAVLFGFGANFLFGLLTALWAAIDCSKLQSQGSRALGLAFKPVVVFAACAFFLWGFGFIWYLIMRHRVKSAPVDLGSESESENVAV